MLRMVASLAEAWIEIELKHHPVLLHYVASLAEAWIEIRCTSGTNTGRNSRFPRGSVD